MVGATFAVRTLLTCRQALRIVMCAQPLRMTTPRRQTPRAVSKAFEKVGFINQHTWNI